jgi:large-conductance mechanosensitive channel
MSDFMILFTDGIYIIFSVILVAFLIWGICIFFMIREYIALNKELKERRKMMNQQTDKINKNNFL